MKKSIIFILSAIFIIMILFIPNNTKALNNSTLIVDYENENFQNFYNTYIEGKLDTILSTCRTRFGVDDVMVAYTKSPFSPYGDAFICYDLSQTETISAYVNSLSSISYLTVKWSNSRSFYIDASDYTYLSNISSSYGSQSMQAFSSPANTSPNSNNEFFTNFLPTSSIYQVPFYSDKDIIIFNNDNNQNSGLFINDTYIQYGEKITLYSNVEKGFLPEDYDYIDYVINSDDLITSANITLKFPVLSEYVPYTFTYNSYFVLDDEPDVQHFLDGGTYTVTSDYVGYTNELLVERKYNLYSYATYYFEVYDALKPNNKVLLQVESFHTDNTGNIYIGDPYIDDNNKDNTANILGGSIFSNFKTSDYGFTAILTAPLRLVKSFDSSVCTAPVIPILGADFTLPCGQTFWNREDITDFKEIYQIIVYGLLCYYLGIDIIRTIQDLKNPDDSRLNVIDL